MKAVLMSIKPRWCELIASGKKTVEVRKTNPKLETPFKCYIYCTADRRKHIADTFVPQTPLFVKNGVAKSNIGREDGLPWKLGNGKVIGEFVCDRIGKTFWTKSPANPLWVDGYDEESCLTNRELYEYSKGGTFYEWHISNLVIYDKPKELGEFLIDCKNCSKKFVGNPNCWQGCVDGCRRITRPPQSWAYVERSESDG